MEPGGCETQNCHVDPGVYAIVMALANAGVTEMTSCHGGGPPHSNWDRVVRIWDKDPATGERAFTIAKSLGMPVWYFARYYTGESDQGWWQLLFEPMYWSDSPWSNPPVPATAAKT